MTGVRFTPATPAQCFPVTLRLRGLVVQHRAPESNYGSAGVFKMTADNKLDAIVRLPRRQLSDVSWMLTRRISPAAGFHRQRYSSLSRAAWAHSPEVLK